MVLFLGLGAGFICGLVSLGSVMGDGCDFDVVMDVGERVARWLVMVMFVCFTDFLLVVICCG